MLTWKYIVLSEEVQSVNMNEGQERVHSSERTHIGQSEAFVDILRVPVIYNGTLIPLIPALEPSYSILVIDRTHGFLWLAIHKNSSILYVF